MVLALVQMSHGVDAQFLCNEPQMSEAIIHKCRQKFVLAVTLLLFKEVPGYTELR